MKSHLTQNFSLAEVISDSFIRCKKSHLLNLFVNLKMDKNKILYDGKEESEKKVAKKKSSV